MIETLFNTLKEMPAYKRLLKDIQAGLSLTGLGLPRATRLFVLATLYNDLNLPLLFVTDRSDRALKIMDEIKFWLPGDEFRIFPEPNPLFYEFASWGARTRRDRLRTLTKLAAYHLPGSSRADEQIGLIAPVRAIMTRTLPRRDFIRNCKMIRISTKISPEELFRSWVDIGYQYSDIVVASGQFSRRGGILDIWPQGEPSPFRFEFFGNEIDTIRSFDPATQRTIQNLDQVLLTPAREILPGKAVGLDSDGKDLDELYIPLVHPAKSSLLDYLPQNSLVIIDDFENIQIAADEIEEQAVKFRRESIKEGLLADDFPIPYTSWSELQDQISGMRCLELGGYSIEEKSDIAGLFTSGQRFAGRLKHFIDYISDINADGEDIVIVSRQVSRLKELWKGRKNILQNNARLTFFDGTLSEGWILSLPDGGHLNLFTDSEIFGWERPKPRQRRRPEVDAPEKDYADLIVNDWVVHIDYGIGRYEGLVKRTVDGAEREYLQVEYNAGDLLYVPVHQADRLSRYIGTTSKPPHLTRLGTAQWSRTKKRVRESVREIALELLELNAKRQQVTGYSFSPDTTWQKDLESAFPYIETEDQLHAIEEVKRDMEKARPMDRLLCGDVGYGKTEVALRAAFKAVLDGKQVGVLVPTTVLAQQHYDTFRQRLAPYPVEVEMLSRFRTNKQQDTILRKLLAGTVDIVIGTHRLVQSDVKFKDLGLVIIDEEQRFGVTHKEYLKKLRTEVDVLTMTATPIPRTLYMALTGVRDISTINTPPEERLPIITHIGPFSPRLTRQAILREMERGGQIFFVHNRVRTIRAMESHLNKLVPEARISVGHGQMAEKELSSVMKRFRKGEIDVLLCTSIIESGLDIPNANTLIVDRADTFGLAQLYQLRGRVGRGAQRAYAYFFRHRRKAPTPEGLERLETIAENTQLGAGYSIAMRDLEMRGAGELLGTQQHGHIVSVGFHLYTRLLAQAVNEIRKDQGKQVLSELVHEISRSDLAIPVNVDLPIAVSIPVFYIPDDYLRLQLYRRLADLRKSTDIENIREEFIDRFGPLPDEVENLFYKIRVKLLAELAGLASVTKEGDQILLKFPTLPTGQEKRDLPVIGFQTRIGKNAYRLLLNEHGDWHKRLLSVLSVIIDLCHRNN